MKKITLLVIFILLVGCSLNSSTEILTDKNTTPDVAIIDKVNSTMLIYQYRSDNMDRGNHDYYDKFIVIDPNYKGKGISRGDVIFFENEMGEKAISRVIALKGEKIKINKGQIYINDKKLDTFYGTAHRLGLEKESYFEKMDKEGNNYSKEEMKKIFEYNMDELELYAGEYYLISDDWIRGKMIVLKEDNIIGKVMGYKK